MMPTAFDATTKHAIFVERLKARAVRDALDLLRPLGEDIFTTVAKSDLENLTRREVQSLVATLNRMIKSGYEPVIEDINETLQEFGFYEGGWQGDMLVRTGLVTDLGVASDADIWAAVNAEPFNGMFLKDWYSGLPSGTARRVREAVTQGYADGRSALDVARDLRGTRTRSGILDASARGAETMVRTAFNHTATAARDVTYAANPQIKYEQHLSILDSRTSAVCFPAETEVVPAGELRSAFRREYRGEMLTITTSGGNKLRCTPNHPILTPRGWLGAAELEEGDQIVKADVGNVSGVNGADNVGVKASIGAIYNAFSHPSVSSVTVEGSAPAQFHGDGMAGDYEVNIASADGVLGDWIESVSDKAVKESLLHGCHIFRSMPCSGTLLNHLVGRYPAINAAQVNVTAAQDIIEPTLAARHGADDGARPHAFTEEPNGLIAPLNQVGGHSSFGRCSGPRLGEEAGNGCGGGIVEPADTGDAFPFPVSLDDVVSIGSEFVSCHVYNLHTHLGYYIAGGVVVKNCRSFDGRIFEKGKGPKPPLHPACRSTRIPVTSKNKSRLENRTTYNDWLKGQSKDFQDDVLGKAKGKLFRDGDLPVQRFVNRAGKEMTLEQLKAADAEAWAETFGENDVSEAVESVTNRG